MPVRNGLNSTDMMELWQMPYGRVISVKKRESREGKTYLRIESLAEEDDLLAVPEFDFAHTDVKHQGYKWLTDHGYRVLAWGETPDGYIFICRESE